ncbi:MAG: hypothetical protein AB1567_05950 [bacterium]
MRFALILMCLLGLVGNVYADTETTTESISTQTTTITSTPIILSVGTYTIGTQTYVVPKEKWALPFKTNIPILGQQIEVIILYIPSVDRFEAIIYLKDRELVFFFDKAEEWISAIALKFQRVIEKELMANINFSTVVNNIDKLARPLKEGDNK